MNSEDASKDHTDETPETGEQLMARLEKEAADKEQDDGIKNIRVQINLFIKDLNKIIGETFHSGSAKKTPVALTIHAVVEGLAVSTAQVFVRIKERLGSDMTIQECEETFLGMFRAAINNIGKNNK